MAAGEESRTVTYLAPGSVPDLTPAEPLLDPKLAEKRDEETKANDVAIEAASEPSIDPALVKARDEQIARETERAEGKPAATPSQPAKKTAAKKSSK